MVRLGALAAVVMLSGCINSSGTLLKMAEQAEKAEKKDLNCSNIYAETKIIERRMTVVCTALPKSPQCATAVRYRNKAMRKASGCMMAMYGTRKK